MVYTTGYGDADLKRAEYSSFLEQEAQALRRQNDARLLFLTFFGSILYDTATPGKSDVDLRGIFLPARTSLALNKAPKSLHFSTSNRERRQLIYWKPSS
jgi:predicted nucleotidyltransferase